MNPGESDPVCDRKVGLKPAQQLVGPTETLYGGVRTLYSYLLMGCIRRARRLWSAGWRFWSSEQVPTIRGATNLVFRSQIGESAALGGSECFFDF